MRRSSSSPALLQSLSEFAYLLLFLTLGGALVLFGQIREAEERVRAAEAEVARLTTEVAFLTEILEEKQYGVVPCWRRPEGEVPPISARIVLHGPGHVSLLRTQDQARRELDGAPAELRDSLLALLQGELRYAGGKNCYLRVAVENRTNDYSLYEQAADVVTEAGMVVAHE